MRNYRCVVIGCGRMGQMCSHRLAADPRALLAGFFDDDRRSAIELRDRNAPDAPVFESVENALAQSNADAAIICTPTSAHASQVRIAASHNLHVLCEKPLGSTRRETLDLIDRDLQLFIGRNNQLERIELPPECSGRDSIQNPVTGFLDLLSGDSENTSPFECALPVFDTTTAILDAAYGPA